MLGELDGHFMRISGTILRQSKAKWPIKEFLCRSGRRQNRYDVEQYLFINGCAVCMHEGRIRWDNILRRASSVRLAREGNFEVFLLCSRSRKPHIVAVSLHFRMRMPRRPFRNWDSTMVMELNEWMYSC